MKLQKRLTRQESHERTRMRLIEAAEALFIRKGFDDTSVDEISEMAGYSRGAFYSNFEDKDQVFLAVIDRRWASVPKAFDDLFQEISEPVSRTAAVRDWYSRQWREKNLIALQMDFSRRALKDRSARKRLAELRREELEAVTASIHRYYGVVNTVAPERPEVLALVLLAVARGLAALAMDGGQERERLYTEAAALAFDHITTPKNFQSGEEL